MDKIVIYDVFVCSGDKEILVATTKNKVKAKVLMEALKDCGTDAFFAGKVIYADDKLLQELTD